VTEGSSDGGARVELVTNRVRRPALHLQPSSIIPPPAYCFRHPPSPPHTHTHPAACAPLQATLPKRPHTELTISYGDKSNEELLLLYGFAVDANPHDQLMIPCPLPPPGEWGDDVRARLALLRARGLAPQVFLPAARLPGLRADGSGSWRRAGGGGKGGGGADDDGASALPPDARRVLEVFVAEPAEVARQLEAAEGGGGDEAEGGGGSGSNASGGGALAAASARVEALGVEMALITTLARLLELKVLELEGETEGTGPLEADATRLETDGPRLAPWLRACLVYRAGQKALARAYLGAARAELQATLRALQRAVEAEDAARVRGAAASGGAAAAGGGAAPAA
jgi:hypothetical protein